MRTLPAFLIVLLAAISPPALAAGGEVVELRTAEVVVRGGGRIIEARGSVRITDGRNTVHAGEAVFAVRERRIRLGAGVVVTSPEGTLKAAEAVVLLSGPRRLAGVEASGGVELHTGGRVLRAGRIRYLVDGPQAVASGRVSLLIPPDLVASGEQLTLRGRRATLSGGAKFQNKDGTIEGDTIEVSDHDHVAQARGNVRSTWQQTRISADAATVHARDRTAIFRGRVIVTQPGRTMRTAALTVYYAERRMIAEGDTTIRLEEGGP